MYYVDIEKPSFSDQNECQEWGYCDQLCSNSFGSYKCSCVDGYIRRNETCVADPSGTSKMTLFFAYQNKIIVMDPNSKTIREVTNATEASGVDFHLNERTIFFTDTEARKIYKLRMPKEEDLLDASTPLQSHPIIDIGNSGTWSPSAIAVDWIGNNLYVVDSLGQKVNIFDMEGLYSSIVVTSNLTSPVDIALDPIMGVMFITDNNRVVRANMDGTHLRPLVEDAVYKASGLALDMITRRVYWSDILLDYIETVDYNGNNRHQIIRGPNNVPAPSR